MILLAGDIGGTNTRLVIAENNGNGFNILFKSAFLSNNYQSLEQVVENFLQISKFTKTFDAACFAVAGPVIMGESKITNLPWKIGETQLTQNLAISRVKLVNDFTSVAMGISELNEDDILLIHKGDVVVEKEYTNAAIIGAGTGLGVSHRVRINNEYHILDSETGHCSFTPANKIQTELLEWLLQSHEHVSLETILSGNGLYTIYRFLQNKFGYTESVLIKNELMTNIPAQVITDHAKDQSDTLCNKTLELFVDIYAAIAGDIALHYYPVDELYIAGGIAPKIKDKINYEKFISSFSNKGKMTDNLKALPVKLILNEDVGLYGALSFMQKTFLH